MKKSRLIWLILILSIFCAWQEVYPQAKSVSRNNNDNIQISKITPRSLAYILKPVNIPFNAEIKYELKTIPKARIVVFHYKVYKDKIEEIPSMRKIYPINKGKNTFTYVSAPIVIPEKDEALKILTVTSMVDDKGRELAFSSSVNVIGGKYKIYPEKNEPDRDYITRLGIEPRVNTDIKTERIIKFNITLKYSLKSRDMAYVDILFSDVADIGTGRCWNAATIAVPKGTGKISLQPEVFFARNFTGRNMGITIVYWLNPLKSSSDVIKIIEYFLI